MTHDNGESTITLYYGLTPLDKVSYVELCISVLDLNSKNGPMNEGKLREIYKGIVQNLFWFEPEEKQFIAEHKVTSLIEPRE